MALEGGSRAAGHGETWNTPKTTKSTYMPCSVYFYVMRQGRMYALDLEANLPKVEKTKTAKATLTISGLY